MKVGLPSLENLVALAGDAGEVSQHLQHNVLLWRWINGAFGMLKDETLPFDTQQDYWYQTHRRFAAAYLHRRLRESYYPAEDLRALAQHLFRHFERASASGALGKFALVQESEWPEYRGLFAAAARELANPPEYGRLKAYWKRLKGATLRDDVLEFYRGIEELASPNEFEPGGGCCSSSSATPGGGRTASGPTGSASGWSRGGKKGTARTTSRSSSCTGSSTFTPTPSTTA